MQTNNEVSNQKIINFLVGRKFKIYRHILLWLGLCFVLLYGPDTGNDFIRKEHFIPFLCVYTIFLAMMYVNMYILVPRFFFRSKYITYGILLVVMIFGGSLVFLLMMRLLSVDNTIIKRNYHSKIIFAILLTLYTTTIKLLQRWIKDSERHSELKTITYQLELNELKKQITPHFLFNMLNNIKALVRSNPIKATDVIIKLSDLLRYQIYESNEAKVSLVSEINFIINFLSLENIRRDNFNFSVRTNKEMENMDHIMIYSNLFITFIENAVKHSATAGEFFTSVNVKFFIDDTHLIFSCINTISSDDKPSKEYGGLGLRNIKRRLELIYKPSEYSLDIEASLHEYSVNLKIPL